VLADESTDVSTEKHMAIVLRYFSVKEQQICSFFAGLMPLPYATGECLFHALKTKFNEFNLSLSDSVGYGSDGASNMIGEHNSLWSRIRAESPHCMQVKCICHSLALCVQVAFNKLPSNLGFILHEIPK